MTRSARVVAQAKVNLLLHVLAREASGYHTIETVFLRLELGDDVRVRIGRGRSLDCRGPSMPSEGLGVPDTNLAYRAAVAYAEATGWPSGFAIEIEKRIPVGGGLGGGSADAGAVLRALDALSPQPVGKHLIELATPLGADVPFMATEHAMAVGWGRGERLLAVPALPSRPVLLALPPFAIATRDAYGWLADARDGSAPHAAVLELAQLSSWDAIAALATNDFHGIVAERQPVIAELADELRAAGAAIAMLSGSGAAVFGVFDHAEPPSAAAVVRSSGCSAIATRTSERVAAVALD